MGCSPSQMHVCLIQLRQRRGDAVVGEASTWGCSPLQMHVCLPHARQRGGGADDGDGSTLGSSLQMHVCLMHARQRRGDAVVEDSTRGSPSQMHVCLMHLWQRLFTPASQVATPVAALLTSSSSSCLVIWWRDGVCVDNSAINCKGSPTALAAPRARTWCGPPRTCCGPPVISVLTPLPLSTAPTET